MLCDMSASRCAPLSMNQVSAPSVDDRYTRSEVEDMQEAIKYLYEFKAKLEKLHPICTRAIENLLQQPRNRY